MTTQCICGGRFRRTDIVQSGSTRLKSGKRVPTYQDTDSLIAHWRCTGCGKTREQRKRQPKEKV